MTDPASHTDPTSIAAAAPPSVEDDAKAAEAERPGHRRSVFWDHADRIRKLLADGRSYQQILRMLHLGHMHRSVLARWCERQGLHSQCPTRPGSRAADKKSAPAASAPAASTAAQATPQPNPPSPISDALGPEPGDEWSAFRKPSAEDRS